MAKAPNKLYGRGEIRNTLRDLANDEGRMLVMHRDAFRKDPSHVEETCRICIGRKGGIDALERAIWHFGGRWHG
jgi:hypothetical protein